MRFRPDPLSNPQAGTAVAVAEVYQGVFRPHVQSAHQALQSCVKCQFRPTYQPTFAASASTAVVDGLRRGD